MKKFRVVAQNPYPTIHTRDQNYPDALSLEFFEDGFSPAYQGLKIYGLRNRQGHLVPLAGLGEFVKKLNDPRTTDPIHDMKAPEIIPRGSHHAGVEPNAFAWFLATNQKQTEEHHAELFYPLAAIVEVVDPTTEEAGPELHP